MMETQMLIGRIMIFALAVALAYYAAFRNTPELDGVKNAWIYRLSFAMIVLRGVGFLAFDMLGLFPME